MIEEYPTTLQQDEELLINLGDGSNGNIIDEADDIIAVNSVNNFQDDDDNVNESLNVTPNNKQQKEISFDNHKSINNITYSINLKENKDIIDFDIPIKAKELQYCKKTNTLRLKNALIYRITKKRCLWKYFHRFEYLLKNKHEIIQKENFNDDNILELLEDYYHSFNK